MTCDMRFPLRTDAEDCRADRRRSGAVAVAPSAPRRRAWPAPRRVCRRCRSTPRSACESTCRSITPSRTGPIGATPKQRPCG